MSSPSSKRRRIMREVEEKLRYIRCSNTLSPTLTRKTVNINLLSEREIIDDLEEDQHNRFIVSPYLVREDIFNSSLEPNVSSELANWSLRNNIPHTALNELLKIVRPHLVEFSLPTDARALLKTPRNSKFLSMNSGSFHYFGIARILNTVRLNHLISCKFPIVQRLQAKTPNLITLSVGIDGLSISKSSNTQFWPILGIINQLPGKSVFLIGLYCGPQKPPIKLVLKDFIQEVQNLEEFGMQIEGQEFKIRISCIIADASARSFLKCCKNHNAYSSCEKGELVGTYYNGRVILNKYDCRKRTDKSFRQMRDEDHHREESPLLGLKLDLVRQFLLDYMHLVCLGITCKLLSTWVKGLLRTRLCSRDIDIVSNKLIQIRKYIPDEFSRKTRSLRDLNRFKATEFRLFLLYTGPVVLLNILPIEQYKHFLMLHCGIFVLVTSRACQAAWNQYANSILQKFVEISSTLYGGEFLVYNTHSLIHLAKDAMNFGPLDNFGAFPFENFMQPLKRMLRAKNKPLQQVVKRVYENESSVPISQAQLESYCCIREFNGVKKYNHKKVLVSNSEGNNCFLTTNKKVFVIFDIILSLENKVMHLGKYFLHQKRIPHYPCSSKRLNIYEVFKSALRDFYINDENLASKCVLMPLYNKKETFYCLPFSSELDNCM